MGPIDVILRRGLVVLSILIVLGLSAVAIFSLIDGTTTDDADLSENPAPPGRAFPGERIQVEDSSFPLSVGCLPTTDGEPGQDNVFSIVLRNLGSTDVDYVVAAVLVNEDGGSERVVVDVPRLQPGQEVEQFVVPGRAIGQVESCAVTAVQTGNRLLLFEAG
ncbi:MAG: hypothetical protein AAF531_11735 [Actinomycetota bacterium]